MFLQDGLDSWLRDAVGVDPQALLPSVRCGLEAAILSAIASSEGISLSQLLSRSQAGLIASEAQPSPQTPSVEAWPVPVNALVNDSGEAGEACQLIVESLKNSGCKAIKVKVGSLPPILVAIHMTTLVSCVPHFFATQAIFIRLLY